MGAYRDLLLATALISALPILGIAFTAYHAGHRIVLVVAVAIVLLLAAFTASLCRVAKDADR